MIIHLYQQQFIELANGSYLYLMEYTWKNNQISDETNKTLNGDLTTEEALLVDEDEEQGEKYKHFFIIMTACESSRPSLALLP